MKILTEIIADLMATYDFYRTSQQRTWLHPFSLGLALLIAAGYLITAPVAIPILVLKKLITGRAI